ncbi:MAG: hypothetical protein J0H74_16645, partial [Chitinophagaceae bacterium]|nr:hypothetical protein [Chitinophagaceae bacterium]
MKPFRKPVVIAVSILISGIALGQNPIPEFSSNYNKPVQILPPAPNAASLGKYGGIDLGLWSGTPNINIPIFEYGSQNIKLPISLSYSSPGFKVDEIASRVGMHWSLNAGGVITRTVNGSIDEQSERIFPPAGMTLNSQMITFMGQLTGDNRGTYDGSGQGPYGHFDGQPDLFTFNFNGYSGQFILDTINYAPPHNNFRPVLLTHSNLKIERYNSTGLDYAYKITTESGIQYFFEVQDLTTSFDTSGSAGCYSPYKQNVPTAWYLTKIVHPNKDSIQLSYTRQQFSYLTSASQTMYKHDQSTPYYWPCAVEPFRRDVPQISDVTCLNKLRTDGAILDEITSTGGGRIKFKYIDRDDYNDKLLSSIEVSLPGKISPYKIFNLSYTYPGTLSYSAASYEPGLNKRPFLMSMTERSPDSTLTKTYSFRYNDYNNLPPRLSYAQDHWGYFNGKSNSTLIPVPTMSTYVTNFPQANADRNADPVYSTKGLLNSIVYPTGGKDSILYEGNQVYTQVVIQPKDTVVSAQGNTNNIFYSSEVYTGYAVISIYQAVTISGYRNPNTTGDPSQSVTTVVLLDQNNNVLLSKALNHTDPTLSFSQQFSLQPGSYRLKITVLGPNNYGGGSISFKKGSVSYEYRNVNSGGVRVSKVMTFDNNTDKTIVKRYFYGKLTDPAISSGVGVAIPSYEKMLKLYKPCREFGTQGYTCDDIAQAQYFTMHSNSIFNIYSNGSLPTAYSNVVESFGDNFENGGIEHEFSIVPNFSAAVYVGEQINGAPESSNSNISGKEIYQNTFKRVGGNNIPVKKTYTHYNIDSRATKDFPAYVGTRKYLYPCLVSDPISDTEAGQFDFMYYYFKRKWIYEDTIRTLTYDDNGSSYMEEKKITTYSNPDHALPTSIQIVDSKGQKITTNLKYPLDYTISNTPNTIAAKGIRNLQNTYVITPVIEQYIQRSNLDSSNLRTVAASLTLYKPTAPVVDTIFGLEISIPTTSFSPTGITDLAVSKNINYKPKMAFDNYDSYGHVLQGHKINNVQEVYLWGYNSQYPVAKVIGSDYTTVKGFINQAILDNPATTDQQMRDELNKIRTGLSGVKALVTTYTYIPLVGMTSATDPRGITTYYEYDGLQRLLRIRDMDGNIVKQYEYQYQAAISCGSNCSILTMTTLAGTGTIGYPVGVFNANGKLLGNATTQSQYISLWNADTANAHRGTLATGADPLHFQFTLIPGKTIPPITGCRYFQMDLPWNNINAITNVNGTYVDFGDGTGMRLGAKISDSLTVLAPNTTQSQAAHPEWNGYAWYFVHTYPDNSLKTLTFYHNDQSELAGLDNNGSPATSLPHLRNLRGNLPQYTDNLGGSCYQDSSMSTVAGITNWNTIHSIKIWGQGSGDGGITPTLHLGYPQDFMAGNRDLESIGLVSTSFIGCFDSTFRISRLKSDWNTYFTHLKSFFISDAHWNREDLSGLKELNSIFILP